MKTKEAWSAWLRVARRSSLLGNSFRADIAQSFSAVSASFSVVGPNNTNLVAWTVFLKFFERPETSTAGN